MSCALKKSGPPKSGGTLPTCFHASFFPFCPLCWPPLSLPFSGRLFALFSPSKSALFCREKGTTQSLERGSFRIDLSRKFGKEFFPEICVEKGQFGFPQSRGNLNWALLIGF